MVVQRLRFAVLVLVLLAATSAVAQDAIPVLDVWVTAGSCRGTVGDGAVMHAGRGGYLVSTDVSDPAAPQLVGLTWFGQQVQDVALIDTGSQVLVAAALGHHGLALVDVTDPAQPVRRGDLLDAEAWRLEWVASRLYVAAATGGIYVVDVADPDAPQITGDLAVRPAHAPRALTSKPGTLYVAAFDDSLEVFTLVDPDRPARLGGARGGNYVDLDCDGATLAALTATGLEFIDVSNFTGLPLLAEWYPADPDGRPMAVLLDGDHAWIADRKLGLHLLDVSDPAAPQDLDLQSWPADQAWSLGMVAEMVALGTADAGVALVVADADAVVSRGRVTEPCPTSMQQLAASEHAVVVTGSFSLFRSLASPPYGRPAGLVSLGDARVEVCGYDGDRAVLGCWIDGYPHTRMAVIDASDPATPELVHFGHGLPTGMNDHTLKAVVEDNVAYVVNSGLRIYDLEVIDQWGPQDIGSYAILQSGLGDFELVDPQRLCIWREEHGLLMLDRTNLWDMTVSEVLPVDTAPEAMAVHGDRFYVAEITTVSVFDISVMGDAVLLGEIDVGGYVSDMVATAGGLWVSLGADGLERWDVTDPAAPVLAAVLADQGRIDELAVSGPRVVANAPYRGLLWLGDATTPTPDLAPPAVALEQNRPNPFNPMTVIGYRLPQAGLVHLAVYDLRGRLVRTLVDGAQAEGRQQVTWDGRDASGRSVATGVYAYRLRAAGIEQARMMVLAK